MHNFKRLTIWQRSIDLVTQIYLLTMKYPKSEIYGLTSQTRRAATSVPLNISEGAAKSSDKDFARFLEMAMGSINELETALIVAKNLQFITEDAFGVVEKELIEIRKMITKFIKGLKSDNR